MLSRIRRPFLGAFVALFALLLLGSARATQASDCCVRPFSCLKVRNLSCLTIASIYAEGDRRGASVVRCEYGAICPRSSAQVGCNPTCTEIDRLYVHVCTNPTQGEGLQAAFPSLSASETVGPGPIKSAFVAVDCRGMGGYLRVYLFDGSTYAVPLERAKGITCPGIYARKGGPAPPLTPATEVLHIASVIERETTTKDHGSKPFRELKVKNNHPTKSIVKVTAKPKLANAQGAVQMLQNIPPNSPLASWSALTNPAQFGSDDADTVSLEVCVQELSPWGRSGTAWFPTTQYPDFPGSMLGRIKDVTVTLNADASINLSWTLWGTGFQVREVSDTITCE